MFKKKEKKGLEKFIKVWKPLDYLFNVILNPRMWISIYRSSKGTSNLLQDLVLCYEDGYCEVKISNSSVNFSNSKFNIDVWILNYPYAYGNSYTGWCEGPLPTRYYRILFNRWVDSIYSKHKRGEA